MMSWLVIFAAGLLSWSIVARQLGAASLGVYGYASWLSSTLVAIATLGIPFATERSIGDAVGRGELNEAIRFAKALLRVQLLIACGLGLLSVLLLPWLNLPDDRVLLVLIIATVLPGALQVAIRSIFCGFQRFGKASVLSTSAALLQLGLVLFARHLQGGVILMLTASLLASVGSVLLALWHFRQLQFECTERAKDLPRVGEKLWRFSAAFSYIALLEYVVWDKSEVFFLRHFSSYQEVGFYTLAFAASAKLVAVAQSFADTLLPIASRSFAGSAEDGLRKIFVDGNRLMLLVLVPLSAAAVLSARQLVLLVFGASFEAAVRPLQVLLIGIPLASLSAVAWGAIGAARKESFLAKGMTAGAVMSIVADYFLICRYGAVGASIATTGAQILIAILFLVYCVRLIRADFPWGTLIRSYAASVAVFMPAYFVRNSALALAIGVCLGGCAYPVILLLLREYTAREARTVLSQLTLREGV